MFGITLNVFDLTDLNMTFFMLLLSKSLLSLSLVLLFHLFIVCCQTSKVSVASEFTKEFVGNRTIVLIVILAIFLNLCVLTNLQTEFFYKEYLVIICFSLISAGFLWLMPYDDLHFALSQNFETSIGACWANGAIMAYYEESLNKFKDRVQKFEAGHPDVTLLVKKLVLIAPLSCNIEGSLSERDENIHHLGDLETIEHDEGANINRKYITPVYKVKYQNTGVFIAAEYPSPLGTLWGERYGMDEDAKIYIRDCFLKELRKQLRNKPVIILEYDDQNQLDTVPLNQFLISSLLEENNIVGNTLHEKPQNYVINETSQKFVP